VLQTLASVALIENADGFRRARESAEKAIALDPNLATGYMALGVGGRSTMTGIGKVRMNP